MKKLISVLSLVIFTMLLATSAFAADAFSNVTARWQKEQKFQDRLGANLTITCTYYSAEYIEASIQQEAQKNLWTQRETDDYKFSYLKALNLDEMIPINIKFHCCPR